jgi:hypothetical protein
VTLRTSAFIVCFFDLVVYTVLAFAAFKSGSDPATHGLDEAAGIIVTGLLLVTSVAALVLAFVNYNRPGSAQASETLPCRCCERLQFHVWHSPQI